MKADYYFKDTPEGRAFYPWGILGSGRIVSTEIEATLKRFINIWMVVAFPVAIVAVLYLDSYGPAFVFAALGASLVVFMAVYIVVIERLCAGCPRAAERLTHAEFTRIQGRSYSWGRIAVLIITSFLFVCGGLFIVAKSLAHPGRDTAIGALCALFFGFCLYRFIAMARARRD
jgi:hypothetical protein